MKKLTTVFCLVLLSLILSLTVRPVHAASVSAVVSNPAVLNSPPSKEMLRLAKMKWFAGLTIEDYSRLKGKKLNFMERLSFRLSQNRVKKMLKRYDYGDVTVLQKISMLLKGLLLGPIAVLLAYLFVGEDERELIKWVWFGFAGFVAIIAVILFVV